MSQEKAPEIGKEEFVEWQNSPVTKFIFKEFEVRKEAYADSIRVCVRNGDYPRASYCEGLVAGIESILDTQYEDVEDES